MKEFLKWIFGFAGIAVGSYLAAIFMGHFHGWESGDLYPLAATVYFWPAWLLFIHYMDHHRE